MWLPHGDNRTPQIELRHLRPTEQTTVPTNTRHSAVCRSNNRWTPKTGYCSSAATAVTCVNCDRCSRNSCTGCCARSRRRFRPGMRITRLEGGYFVWVELPRRIDALELHRLALSHDISVAPGHLFSADRHRYTHRLSVNFGHPKNARVEAALKSVGQIAKALMPDATWCRCPPLWITRAYFFRTGNSVRPLSAPTYRMSSGCSARM